MFNFFIVNGIDLKCIITQKMLVFMYKYVFTSFLCYTLKINSIYQKIYI